MDGQDESCRRNTVYEREGAAYTVESECESEKEKQMPWNQEQEANKVGILIMIAWVHASGM